MATAKGVAGIKMRDVRRSKAPTRHSGVSSGWLGGEEKTEGEFSGVPAEPRRAGRGLERTTARDEYAECIRTKGGTEDETMQGKQACAPLPRSGMNNCGSQKCRTCSRCGYVRNSWFQPSIYAAFFSSTSCGNQLAPCRNIFFEGKKTQAQRADTPAVALVPAPQSSASCAFTHTVRPGSLMRVVCV